MIIITDKGVVICLSRKSKAEQFACIRSDEEKFADELRKSLNPQEQTSKTIQELTLEKILKNAHELSWQVTAAIRHYPKRKDIVNDR